MIIFKGPTLIITNIVNNKNVTPNKVINVNVVLFIFPKIPDELFALPLLLSFESVVSNSSVPSVLLYPAASFVGKLVGTVDGTLDGTLEGTFDGTFDGKLDGCSVVHAKTKTKTKTKTNPK